MNERNYTLKSKILDAAELQQATEALADQIYRTCGGNSTIGLIGIRTRGEFLAGRIHRILEGLFGKSIPLGYLDVSFYRDDTRAKLRQPVVQSTHVPFDVNDCTIVLVDDVLYTGRSVRAAMDELMDFGRPACVRLAVLIDRGHRELPIQADYVGLQVKTTSEEQVRVKMREVDDAEEVLLLVKNATD